MNNNDKKDENMQDLVQVENKNVLPPKGNVPTQDVDPWMSAPLTDEEKTLLARPDGEDFIEW